MKNIALDIGKVRRLSWKAHLVRFTLGGLVTAGAGLIGAAYGPAVGGLFLAFPSISTASLSLIQRQAGKNAAGVDAWGAAIGSLGLLGFAAVVWVLAPLTSGWVTLLTASAVWLPLSFGLWLAIRTTRRHLNRRQRKPGR